MKQEANVKTNIKAKASESQGDVKCQRAHLKARGTQSSPRVFLQCLFTVSLALTTNFVDSSSGRVNYASTKQMKK